MSAIHRAADHPTGVRPAFVGREVSRYRGRRRPPAARHRSDLFRDGLLALSLIALGLLAIWWAVLGMMP
jgi:hypothetical protein